MRNTDGTADELEIALRGRLSGKCVTQEGQTRVEPPLLSRRCSRYSVVVVVVDVVWLYLFFLFFLFFSYREPTFTSVGGEFFFFFLCCLHASASATESSGRLGVVLEDSFVTCERMDGWGMFD